MKLQMRHCILLLIVPYLLSGLSLSQAQENSSDSFNLIPNFNISNNTGDSVYPAIATSSKYVYVVWQDDYVNQSVSLDKKNYDILFTRSNDGGINFENVTNISNNLFVSSRPSIATFESYVYIIWLEDTGKNKELWIAKSKDTGRTFDKPLKLASVQNWDYLLPKSIAAYGDHVYVVWRQLSEDGKSGSILFKSSQDRANTFSETREISDKAAYITEPKVDAFQNNVYVVWNLIYSKEETPTQSDGLFFAKSSDHGDNFGTDSKLNGNNEFGEAELASYSNRVYVAWTGSVYKQNQNMSDLFFTSSLNNGDSFEDTVSINNGLDSGNVGLTVTDRYIDAVWQDNVTGNGEIFHKRIMKDIPDFSESSKNLSNTDALSECPSIATSDNDTFVVWEDSTYGNHEIFFKKIKQE
jgi:hypothetical protein